MSNSNGTALEGGFPELSSEEQSSVLVDLNNRCQKIFQKSYVWKQAAIFGPRHSPTFVGTLILPDGKEYTGIGCNTKDAKAYAAQRALPRFPKNPDPT